MFTGRRQERYTLLPGDHLMTEVAHDHRRLYVSVSVGLCLSYFLSVC